MVNSDTKLQLIIKYTFCYYICKLVALCLHLSCRCCLYSLHIPIVHIFFCKVRLIPWWCRGQQQPWELRVEGARPLKANCTAVLSWQTLSAQGDSFVAAITVRDTFASNWQCSPVAPAPINCLLSPLDTRHSHILYIRILAPLLQRRECNYLLRLLLLCLAKFNHWNLQVPVWNVPL